MIINKQTTVLDASFTEVVQARIESEIDSLLASLPAVEQLSNEQRRGIIARYTAVLEGNFIYWMTATYLAVQTQEAKEIIEENLLEEVKENHPGMLRRFVIAADAAPSNLDRVAVDRDLENVRTFVGKLSPMEIVPMMAFFEGFIAKFMGYLADLAAKRGSTEMVYTDVHGVCDISHTQGLFTALGAELAVQANTPDMTIILGGVKLLRTLIETIIRPA